MKLSAQAGLTLFNSLLVISSCIGFVPAFAANAEPSDTVHSTVLAQTTDAATSVSSESSADQAQKTELVKQVLEASRATRNAQIGYDAVIDQQLKGMHAALDNHIDSDTKLTPEQKQEAKRVLLARLNKRMVRAKELLQEKINLGKLVVECYVKVYDKNFSVSELKDMLAWYKSPTAQKQLELLPAMTQEMTTLINAAIFPKLKELDDQLAVEDEAGKFNP